MLALLDSDPAGAGDILEAGQKGEIGVADGQAFEVVVVGGHHVEEVEISIAVEDRLAVARGFDDDRLFRRAALRQVISAVGGRCPPAHRLRI